MINLSDIKRNANFGAMSTSKKVEFQAFREKRSKKKIFSSIASVLVIGGIATGIFAAPAIAVAMSYGLGLVAVSGSLAMGGTIGGAMAGIHWKATEDERAKVYIAKHMRKAAKYSYYANSANEYNSQRFLEKAEKERNKANIYVEKLNLKNSKLFRKMEDAEKYGKVLGFMWKRRNIKYFRNEQAINRFNQMDNNINKLISGDPLAIERQRMRLSNPAESKMEREMFIRAERLYQAEKVVNDGGASDRIRSKCQSFVNANQKSVERFLSNTEKELNNLKEKIENSDKEDFNLLARYNNKLEYYNNVKKVMSDEGSILKTEFEYYDLPIKNSNKNSKATTNSASTSTASNTNDFMEIERNNTRNEVVKEKVITNTETHYTSKANETRNRQNEFRENLARFGDNASKDYRKENRFNNEVFVNEDGEMETAVPRKDTTHTIVKVSEKNIQIASEMRNTDLKSSSYAVNGAFSLPVAKEVYSNANCKEFYNPDWAKRVAYIEKLFNDTMSSFKRTESFINEQGVDMKKFKGNTLFKLDFKNPNFSIDFSTTDMQMANIYPLHIAKFIETCMENDLMGECRLTTYDFNRNTNKYDMIEGFSGYVNSEEKAKEFENRIYNNSLKNMRDLHRTVYIKQGGKTTKNSTVEIMEKVASEALQSKIEKSKIIKDYLNIPQFDVNSIIADSSGINEAEFIKDQFMRNELGADKDLT